MFPGGFPLSQYQGQLMFCFRTAQCYMSSLQHSRQLKQVSMASEDDWPTAWSNDEFMSIMTRYLPWNQTDDRHFYRKSKPMIDPGERVYYMLGKDPRTGLDWFIELVYTGYSLKYARRDRQVGEIIRFEIIGPRGILGPEEGVFVNVVDEVLNSLLALGYLQLDITNDDDIKHLLRSSLIVDPPTPKHGGRSRTQRRHNSSRKRVHSKTKTKSRSSRKRSKALRPHVQKP